MDKSWNLPFTASATPKCTNQSSITDRNKDASALTTGKNCQSKSLNKRSQFNNNNNTHYVKDGRRYNTGSYSSSSLSSFNGSDRRSSRQRGSGGGSGAVVASHDWDGQVSLFPSQDSPLNASGKKVYGSKKHNLNHLLNFSFSAREDANMSVHGMGGQVKTYRGQQRGRNNKFVKEQFIQANCQFIVRDGHDYAIHAVDPDVSVEWNLIEEIRFNCLTSETSCPICLDSPISAKITKCGHIYCWSCILHYFSLSDHKWRKCPICFDAIKVDELKSVSSVAKLDYKIGDEITLMMMKRKKGCTIITPTLLATQESCFSNLQETPLITCHQKILIASPQQILKNIIERERHQLECQMIDQENTPEVCFAENALQLLMQREESLMKECGMFSSDHLDVNVNSDESKVEFNSQASNQSIDEKHHSFNKKLENQEFYHFYQAEDGQHIYLHSLNLRMLRRQFGEIESCPDQIRAKIVGMEWSSMTDQLRKRLRYMQHLPLTCEFRIVELKLEHDLISYEVMEEFNSEIIARQKARNRRDREEKRRDRFIQVEENKRIFGIYPLPKYQLNNYKQFPSVFDDDLNETLRSSSPEQSECSTLASEELSVRIRDIRDDISTCSGTSPPKHESEFMSFATMLREGKSKPVETMVDSKKGWNKAVSTNVSENASAISMHDAEDEYQPPQYQYSLCDAFEAALVMKSSQLRENSEIENGENRGAKKGKKKGRNKQKVLFATGMRQ